MKVKILVILLVSLLTSCLSNVFTGANLIYDRHNVYLKIDDVQLTSFANRALFRDKIYTCSACIMEVMVFNHDLLLVGTVPTALMRDEAGRRLEKLRGHRQIFNQLYVNAPAPNDWQDSWITLKIRSYIVSNAEIDPHSFKVLTWNGVVYFMGDVLPKQASLVVNYANQCYGVVRVVKLFRYYHLSKAQDSL